MSIKKISIGVLVFVLGVCSINAQQHLDPEYIKVTEGRAAKIVAKLELSDTAKEKTVTGVIAKQYQNLSQIHDGRDAKIKDVKDNSSSKEKQEKEIAKLKKAAEKKINKLHKSYIKQLAISLNETQVSGVKDGMTYGVLPITYAGYQDMLASLTEKQKSYIYKNLVEAREHAIDGGSSKEKHGWFGKYKGRINNYLSSQGYDLHKESLDWQERVRQRNAKQ